MKTILLTDQRVYFCGVIISIFIAVTAVFAEGGGYWNLPANIHDSNTEIKFTVDSTWHTVHGSTHGLGGKVWLENVSEFNSIKAEIHIPVNQFDTNSSGRDKKMRKVMDEPEFPEVLFNLDSVSNLCNPQELVPDQDCPFEIHGKLTIRDVTNNIEVPAVITKHNDNYVISGEVALNWGDYGVEDPSIFIAKVQELVKITFSMTL